MNQTIKQKWVDALRSGEYEQGTGCLKNSSGKYCCLGVLCDLAAKEGIVRERWERGSSFTQLQYYYDGESSFLPKSVSKWADLDDILEQVEYKDSARILYTLNDVVGLTFDEIADLIEEQL